MIPAHCPEDSPINNLSNTAAASGKLIKVAEAAAADWLVVLIGGTLTDVRPKGIKLSMFAPMTVRIKGCYLGVMVQRGQTL